MNTNDPPSSVSVEPTSLDAMFVVGGQRMSIRVSVEPKPVADNGPLKINATPKTTEDDIPEEDIYLLLQGPAHIRPLNGTGDGIEVIFLDESGSPTKEPIKFTFKPDPADPVKNFMALKVTSLQIIVECNKQVFEEAEQQGQLGNYFPKLRDRIIQTPENMFRMNPPDPPFPKPQPK